MAHVPDYPRLVQNAAQQVLTCTLGRPCRARIRPGRSLSVGFTIKSPPSPLPLCYAIKEFSPAVGCHSPNVSSDTDSYMEYIAN